MFLTVLGTRQSFSCLIINSPGGDMPLIENVYKIIIFKGKRKWYFHAHAKNNKIVAASEGYYSKWNAKRAAKKVFPQAEIEVNKHGGK